MTDNSGTFRIFHILTILCDCPENLPRRWILLSEPHKPDRHYTLLHKGLSSGIHQCDSSISAIISSRAESSRYACTIGRCSIKIFSASSSSSVLSVLMEYPHLQRRNEGIPTLFSMMIWPLYFELKRISQESTFSSTRRVL